MGLEGGGKGERGGTSMSILLRNFRTRLGGCSGRRGFDGGGGLCGLRLYIRPVQWLVVSG